MKHNKVGSVMTTEVVRAEYGTPFKEVARLLGEHRISGLPVVDEDEKVIGVISETDLMIRQAETPDPYEPKKHHRLAVLSRDARTRAVKTRARTAGQLMTEPPVTVHADNSIVEAARTMAQHHVERLPVLDEENRLVGIVTRRDLLSVFLRPDEEMRREIVEEVLVRALAGAPQRRRLRGGGRGHPLRPHGTQERDGDRRLDDPSDRRGGRRRRQAHVPAGRRAHPARRAGTPWCRRRLAAPAVS